MHEMCIVLFEFYNPSTLKKLSKNIAILHYSLVFLLNIFFYNMIYMFSML